MSGTRTIDLGAGAPGALHRTGTRFSGTRLQGVPRHPMTVPCPATGLNAGGRTFEVLQDALRAPGRQGSITLFGSGRLSGGAWL